jgi:hypothetical protein
MTTFYPNYSLERITKVKSLNNFCNSLLRQKKTSLIELREELNELICSGFITELINNELENLHSRNLYVTTPASFNHFTIFDSPLYSLFLISKSAEDLKMTIFGSPHSSDRFIIPLDKNGFIGDLFKQDNPYPTDILDKTKKLSTVKENYHFKQNELIFLEKDCDILSYSPLNESDITFLAFYSKIEGQYVWEYNLKTLLPERIVAGNFQSTSRLEQACTLLGEIGNIKSLPYLQNLLHHPEFNVRWESAKSIMMIDLEKGINALEFLKNDEHPEIIKSVDKSFKQLTNLKLI